MRIFTTEIKAINPLTGELTTYSGPHIQAISWKEAEHYAKNNLGYCKVEGELIAEVDMDGKVISFENLN